MLKTPGARKGEFELHGMDLFTQQTATLKVIFTNTLLCVCDHSSAWVYLNHDLIYTRYFVLSRSICKQVKITGALHTHLLVYILKTYFSRKREH